MKNNRASKTAAAVLACLRRRGCTLACAESCTGGLAGAVLTAVPGASAAFLGGVISYTNEVKQGVLGVQKETLDRYTAVSAQTAREMAQGVRELLHSDFAFSLTGYAGPDGGADGTPVGTVYIGISTPQGSFAGGYCFAGDRDAVREAAVAAALEAVLDALDGGTDESGYGKRRP